MENVDWGEALRNRSEMKHGKILPKKEAKVDKEISNILGREIKVNDPRLIRAAVERAKKNDTDFTPSDGWDSRENKQILNKHFS
jgi:hypothetical protein